MKIHCNPFSCCKQYDPKLGPIITPKFANAAKYPKPQAISFLLTNVANNNLPKTKQCFKKPVMKCKVIPLISFLHLN